MKYFLLLVIGSIYLFANGIDQKDLQAIYLEAAAFVAVVVLMSIVSIVVSKKNAKEYAKKHPPKKKERKEPSSSDRVIALNRLHKEGLLTDDELEVLKKTLYKDS